MHQPGQPVDDFHDIRVLCHHVLPPTSTAPAHSCGSPALRDESFCFYHHPGPSPVLSRDQRHARQRARRIARQSVTVPLPTTRQELLHSLNHIIALIAANQIDLGRANLLILALNAAGQHLTE